MAKRERQRNLDESPFEMGADEFLGRGIFAPRPHCATKRRKKKLSPEPDPAEALWPGGTLTEYYKKAGIKPPKRRSP